MNISFSIAPRRDGSISHWESGRLDLFHTQESDISAGAFAGKMKIVYMMFARSRYKVSVIHCSLCALLAILAIDVPFQSYLCVHSSSMRQIHAVVVVVDLAGPGGAL
jgi:hypothetical protein